MSAYTDAARAAITAAWPVGRVYAVGKVPDLPQTPYVVLYSDGGRDDVLLNDATAGSDAYRLMPMVVGKTEGEIGRGVAGVRAGLRNKTLTIDGFVTTPLTVESTGGITRDPDGGELLSLTMFLTFNAFATA